MKFPKVCAAAQMAALLIATAAHAASADPPAGLKLDRMVLLMRHGVRAPDHAPPTPPGVAAEAWPSWPAKTGWLTEHGAAAIILMADYDRRRFIAAGILPKHGCPAEGAIAIRTNSLERTIATGEAYASAIAPTCAVKVDHRPQDTPDPLFPWGFEHGASYDPDKANADALAVLQPGGPDAVAAETQPLLVRLDHILCGDQTSACGVAAHPTLFQPGAAGRQPSWSGGLQDAGEPAQDLVLEYAGGWPLSQVGWGRASPADITAISALTVMQFRLGFQPVYTARLNDGPVMGELLAALRGPEAPRLTVFVAHDGNIASLAGLLGLHWQVPGLAADYAALGGALGFERLIDSDGRVYVRAVYRSQTLEQIRSLTPLGRDAAPYWTTLPVPGCHARGVAGLCSQAEFDRRLAPRP